MNGRGYINNLPARKSTWLLLALIVAANFAIRWHLRTMPLERDEGEYAYAGQLLLQGVPPYQAAWNMKFPGTYFSYALLMAVFGQTAEGIHLGIILVTSLSITFMFFIGRMLLSDLGGLMAAGLFGMMSAIPWTYGLAGHATHLVVLFVCAGSCALLRAEGKFSRMWLIFAGAAFGTAVLMKQHAAVFCVAAGAWLIWQKLKQKSRWFTPLALFVAGVALPLVLTAAGLALCGVWNRFTFWTIEYARQYVSILAMSTVPKTFAERFGPIFFSAVWPWLLGLAALGLIFFKTQQRRAVVAGAGLFFAGLVALCPGFYFRGHYFLMVMPGLALLTATLLLKMAIWLKKFPRIPQLRFLPPCLFLVVVVELFLRNGTDWFLSSPDQVCREIYGNSPFPESPAIAAYLAANSSPTDTVAVLGSEPQIFFLAHRRSATGYIYVYSLTEKHPLAGQMRSEFIREIESAQPRFVVYDNTLSSWCSVFTHGKSDRAMGEINTWWANYAQNYEMAGKVDIYDDRPTEFYWDDNLANRTNTGLASVFILRRK
ncbi:MAG: glycosyltransferase family 39 protein [Limisphaerales bacterium]